MRSVPTDLATHLATRGAVPLALCADVRWNDGAALHFTSWDRDHIIPEEGADDPIGAPVYVAGLGLSVSKVQGNSDGKVDSLEVKLLLGRSEVTADEINQGRWRGATISLFLVNPEDWTMGRLKFHAGTIGQTTLERAQATAEFLGLMQRYLSTIGEVVTATCQNEFCGAVDSRGRGCGLDIADFTYTGAVTGWDPDGIVVDSTDFDGFADNFFNGGRLTFDDQDWITFGIAYSIQADGILKIKQKPPFDVTPGMAITVTRGCSKEFATCTDTYSNGARFRGFPHLKGNDKLFQTGQK